MDKLQVDVFSWTFRAMMVQNVPGWDNLSITTQETILRDMVDRWDQNERVWSNVHNFWSNYIDNVMSALSDKGTSIWSTLEVWGELLRSLNIGA
jgi:hypothetical protein